MNTISAGVYKLNWFSRLFKPFEWPKDLPPAKEVLDQLFHKDALQSSVMDTEIGLSGNKMASRLGHVYMGLPEEQWPEYQGQQMVGVAQINLEESTITPDCLNDLKLITVFMARGNDQYPIDFHGNDDKKNKKCIIRSYKNLDQLVPYQDIPKSPADILPQKLLTYITCWDPHPQWDLNIIKYKEQYGKKVYRILEQLHKNRFRHINDLYETKVGGYPAPIDKSNDRPLAFQLNCSDIGLDCIVGGCVYFWRNSKGTEPEWKFEMDFY